MKKVLLTGATGFLGSYVARLLIGQGFHVIATHRKTSQFDLVQDVRNQIEWKGGNLNDLSFLEETMEAVDIVIHCAALISFLPQDAELMHHTNVIVTEELVNMSLAYDVERFIHVSSIAALGRHKNDETLDENVEWQDGSLNTAYGISKQMAEREVWRGSAEGLDIVIINPSMIIGAGYWAEGSPAMIAQLDNGLSFYPKGTTGFVDVRDVAELCLKAVHSSKSGIRVIASCQNMTYKRFFSRLSEDFGKKAPSIALTKSLISLAWRAEWIVSKILRRKRLFTKESLTAASRNGYYNNSLSKEIFDHEYRNMEQSLSEMVSVYKKSKVASQNYGILPLERALKDK